MCFSCNISSDPYSSSLICIILYLVAVCCSGNCTFWCILSILHSLQSWEKFWDGCVCSLQFWLSDVAVSHHQWQPQTTRIKFIICKEDDYVFVFFKSNAIHWLLDLTFWSLFFFQRSYSNSEKTPTIKHPPISKHLVTVGTKNSPLTGRKIGRTRLREGWPSDATGWGWGES